MTPEEKKIVQKAELLKELKTGHPEFWDLLEEHARFQQELFLDMSQLRPEHSQWYAGAASGSLDFLRSLVSIESQRDAVLEAETAAANERQTAKADAIYRRSSPQPI